MENASKALIIAGGVLVTIVILTIGIELFVGYREIAENYDYTMTITEISKINKEYTKYIGRKDITIQEVVTAARTAKDYNEKYGPNTIVVKVNSEIITEKENSKFPELIKDKLKKKYEVDISYYDETSSNEGLVEEVVFREV